MLCFYGGLQIERLAIYGETVVTMSVSDSYFSPEETFPSDVGLIFSGFNIAFGFTAYDGSPERIDDPKIGRIRAKYVSWGSGTNGVGD